MGKLKRTKDFAIVKKDGKIVTKFRLISTAAYMKPHYEKIHLQKLEIKKIR